MTLLFLINVSDKALYNEIICFFDKCDIPYNNLICMLMDSCNAMRDSITGDGKYVRAKIPHMLNIDGGSYYHIHNS